MSDKPRPSKLKFKGDKKTKKRKREDGDEGHNRSKGDDVDPETWVMPENQTEIRGPTFIFHPSDPTPICITYDATRKLIKLASLDRDKEGEEDSPPVPLLERKPTDVSQVWVITRIAGSSTVNLRTGTGEGKFLSCDKHGLITCDRDARGPQEEWTPVVLSDGMVAFMSVYETYLALDEIAGGQLQLRGDSDEVGFRERFYVKIQAKYKREAHEEEKAKEMGTSSTNIDEASSNKIYQAWGAGRSIVSKADKRDLKKAKTEGRLAEAMLDRRSKLKSDRFC